jgi:hypothetical protein
VDPIQAGVGRNFGPQGACLRSGGGERLPQIWRHFWFRVLWCRRDLKGNIVTCVCARSFAQLPVHFEPVALLAVWLERGLKSGAIDCAFDRRHASRRKLRTGALWQDEKSPGAGLLALGRPEEFRFKTDQGFGHWAGVIDRIALFGRCAVGSSLVSNEAR